MQAINLINLCAREINDIGFVRIAKDAASVINPNQANWLDWVNDAQRAVCLMRPDANSVVGNITLVLGPRQALPAGSVRLLGVTRNMGADGLTIGKALIFTKEFDLHGIVNPDWMSTAAASPVREVIYDEKRDPLNFWVFPPAIANWKIEANMAKSPTDVADTGQTGTGALQISDVYAGPMQSWMLFRAYALATQALNQFQRAQFYFKSFFNQLGVKIHADMFFSERAPEGYPPNLAWPQTRGGAGQDQGAGDGSS
jgi:hypothetical protein